MFTNPKTPGGWLLALFMLAAAQGEAAVAAESASARLSIPESERVWNSIKAFGQPQPEARTDTKQTPSERAAVFVSQADQLRGFYSAYPGHASAKGAKRLEAMALNWAAFNGDRSQDQRRMKLIDEVRKDSALLPAHRFEIVAWSNQVALSRQKPVGRAAYLLAQESATRQLIAEFPSLSEGHESLLAVARDSASERGRLIVRDILASSAPVPVKAGAQTLSARLDLIGKSASVIFGAAGAASVIPQATGKPLVIYSWATGNSASREAAKRLARRVPQASFVGINLDSGTLAATNDPTLPGAQYIVPQGASSPLAAALAMNEPGLAYLVGSDGVIRDVQAYVATTTKNSNLAR